MHEKVLEEAAKQILKPFYEDTIQPAAREAGKGIQAVIRMVNQVIFLAEDGVKAIENVVRLTAEQAALLPPDRIIKPNPRIAVPIIEDARLAWDEPELQIMFANLLTASMDSEAQDMVHPAFVEIIRNLSSDEARIIGCMAPLGRYPMIEFVREYNNDGLHILSTTDELSTLPEDAGCKYPEKFRFYVQNLKRLDLLTTSSGTQFCQPEDYDRVCSMAELDRIREKNPHMKDRDMKKKMFVLSLLGRDFCRTVVGKTVNVET